MIVSETRPISRVVLRLFCLAWLAAAVASAGALPADWSERADAALPGERLFEFNGLSAPEFARVRIFAPVQLNGTALKQWLVAAVAADSAPAGHWSAGSSTTVQSASLVTASRPFTLEGGQNGAVIYFASTPDGRQANLYRVEFSSAPIARGPAGSAAQTLVADFIRGEKASPRHAADAQLRSPAPAPQTSAPVAPVARAGSGLKLADIETVFYHWDQRYDAFQGLVLKEQVFVLLKDGSAYDRFKLPIEDLDVAASRRQEPQNWGRWRRESSGYAFAWPFAPTKFRRPRGNAVEASPKGTTLQGRFTGASSYNLPGGGVSTWSESTLTLTKAGTFSFERSGGAAISGGGGDASTMTVYDNDQVSSSTNSGVMAGGSRTKRPDQGDRRGRYLIDGYTIELRFENGVVERRPFFIDDGGAGIWFRGARLMRQKEKPAQPR